MLMFQECHCTGVVYNETVMLSRTFSPVRETNFNPTFQSHFDNLHQGMNTAVYYNINSGYFFYTLIECRELVRRLSIVYREGT